MTRSSSTALLHALAEELRRLTGHVEELHFLDLAGRLSMRLVRLRATRATAQGRVELDWPYTQSDLAAMIGGTRQSVNKLLSGLVDDGLIEIERETLVIHDLAELERGADELSRRRHGLSRTIRDDGPVPTMNSSLVGVRCLGGETHG